jgi:FkbM family methyltransferase
MAVDKLREALRAIGADDHLRTAFIALCLEVEAALSRDGYDVREEVAGPIVEALLEGAGVVGVTLEDATRFEVPYRDKIARDLAMRTVENPDHVFEPQTTKLLLHVARDARHVLIGGAYSGDHAVLLARRLAHSGGVVHAFEPNPDQMHWLRHNAALNNVENIRFNECALWERSDVRLKLVGHDAFARTEETDAFDPDGLEVTTIDDYAAREGIESFDAIMLDVEGGELPILRGARAMLSRSRGNVPAIIFEVNNTYVDWSQGLHRTVVVEYLRSFGYESYGIRDYQSNVDLRGFPIELVPVEGAYIGGPRHGFNVVAVRDAAAIASPSIRIVPGLSPKLLRHRDPALHGPNR